MLININFIFINNFKSNDISLSKKAIIYCNKDIFEFYN